MIEQPIVRPEKELAFARLQLHMLTEASQTQHRASHVQMRIAALHQRIDRLEADIRKEQDL